MIASFIFFPEKSFYADPRDFGLMAQDVFLTSEDSARLHGWFFEVEEAEAALLFLHGNAGNISGRLSKAKGWVERGISVLLLDYRGYGKSGGRIQKGIDLLTDARAGLRWLAGEKKIPAERIILYGESIGSYPAIELARGEKFAGLVLEAPFTTLRELAKTHYPWVPEFLLKDFQMENEEAIAEAKAPVFVLHGNQDEISPRSMGERLYERAPSPKELYVVPGGGHNDLPEVADRAYFEYPYRFLAQENGFE